MSKDDIRLAIRGYLVLGSWAILWIVAAVMCARLSSGPSHDMHNLSRDNARGVIMQVEK